jgi:multiple sugar transport system substrate-binding protein
VLFLSCQPAEKKFTIWIGGSPQELEYWQQTVDTFNRRYSTNLQLVRQPTYTDQRRQTLIVSLNAQQPNPDLFLIDVVWMKQFILSGWLEPLDVYAARDSFPTHLFFEKILQSVDRSNGSLYALPVFLDAGLLYARTDLLERYQCSIPETWEELLRQSVLIQAEERRHNRNFNGFVWQGAQYEGLICTFLEFVASNGGAVLQNGNVVVNSDQNIAALTFMQHLIHAERVSPVNTFTEMKEEEVRRSFQRGEALFERNWSYAWNLHQRDDSPVRDKFSVHPLPSFRNGTSSPALGGWHIGLSVHSDMKETAWEFIRFVTAYETQKEMTKTIGWNPAREDVYDDAELLRLVPHLPVLKKSFDHAVTRPAVPYYPQISEVLQKHVNACLSGAVSARAALDAAQSEIDRLVKVYEK